MPEGVVFMMPSEAGVQFRQAWPKQMQHLRPRQPGHRKRTESGGASSACSTDAIIHVDTGSGDDPHAPSPLEIDLFRRQTNGEDTVQPEVQAKG